MIPDTIRIVQQVSDPNGWPVAMEGAIAIIALCAIVAYMIHKIK